MPNSPFHKAELQLWLAHVEDNTYLLEQETIKLLSLSEKQQLTAIKSIKRKREFLLSRALMRHALTQQYGLPTSEWAFVYKKGFAPCISNTPPGTYCSLTHSDGVICFVTSRFPIGVDIENTSKKRRFFELASGFMNDVEIKHFHQFKAEGAKEFFYRTWCAKEALYKASGENQPTQNKDSSILHYLNNHSDWQLLELNLDQFLLAIATHEKSPLITKKWLPVKSKA